MKISIRLIIPILFFMLGCGSKPYVKHHIPKTYRAKNISKNSSFDADSKHGVILFSVTQTNKLSNGSIYLKSLANRDTFYARALNQGGWGLGDSDFFEVKGRLFAVEVKSGKYGFDRWLISSDQSSIHPRYDLEEIEFTVAAGKVTYIGEIHFHFEMGENLFGMSRVFGGYPEIKSSFERDYALFKKRYPQFSDVPYVINVEQMDAWVGLKKYKDLNIE